MIGLVLVTHGQLAEEFRHAVEHVVGHQENLETVSIGAEDDMEQRRRDIVDAVARADTGAGEVIAGVNLPMLIKLSSARANDDMAQALEEAQAAGRKYINVASQVLSGK
jgi:mannose PTS system EIIA component